LVNTTSAASAAPINRAMSRRACSTAVVDCSEISYTPRWTLALIVS